MRAAALDLDLPVSDADRRGRGRGPRRAGLAWPVGQRALGTALANAINLIDVENVVLGGIYAPLAPFLIPSIEEPCAPGCCPPRGRVCR